jgi:hypothetical protein
MATKLYYHRTFARVRLQEIPHLLGTFHIAPPLFVAFVLLFHFHGYTHTLNSKHALTNTKERKKK